MAKRLFFTILALICLTAIAVGALWRFAPRSVTNADLQRDIPSSVYVGRTPFRITDQIGLASYADCEQGSTPLDIVVLIDVSGSMEGPPLTQALAGARRFIDSMDLSRHQIALFLFNGDIVNQTGLTSDQNAFDVALSTATANGDTDLALALRQAAAELTSMRRRFDSSGTVLLFSDGGSDKEAAIQAARQLKDKGVQIFVVGLQGDALDEDLLAAIASSPDTLRIAPRANELVTLFENIAQRIGSYVLTDVRYFEPVNREKLAIDPKSLSSGAQITNEGLLWQADALTKDQALQFTGVDYVATPQRYGYFNVVTDNAVLVLNACGATRHRQFLPPGPRILVLPPLPFLLGIPLALLLLSGLLFLLSGRDRKTNEAPPHGGPKGSHNPPPPPSKKKSLDLGITAWLNSAEDLDPEQGRTPEEALTSMPLLIVGLGSSGREVLTQVTSNLTDRFGDRWPDNIQFLQIDLPPDGNRTEGDALPAGVTEVALSKDIGRLKIDQPHLRWARDASAQGSVRGQGRMALFADLGDGKENSQLWAPLGKKLANRTNLTIWIVSDGFGQASGIIADIAHLLRVRAGRGIISSIRLCLAMENAQWPNGRNHDYAERCFATIRELQRLQRSGETMFAYTPEFGQQELHAASHGKLLDEIYLFDGIGENANGDIYDISQLPARDGVLRVIGNGLLALFEPSLSQQFFENERNAQSEPSRAGESDLENYGSSMGCAVLRAPIEPTRRLAELRLVHYALFHPDDGVFGWGVLDKAGRTRPKTNDQARVRERDMALFWKRTGINPERLNSRGEDDRLRLLVRYLDRVMNDGQPLRLRWALAFLDRLEHETDYGPAVQEARRHIQEWLAVVVKVQQGAGDVGSKPSRTPGASLLDIDFSVSSRSAELDGPDTGALMAAWQSKWEATRDRFPSAAAIDPEQPVWGIDQEFEIFERYIRDLPSVADRLRGRSYWLWSTQPALRLRLLILPNNLSAPTPEANHRTIREQWASNPFVHALTPADGDQIITRLLQAARTQSREIQKERVALFLDGPINQTRLDNNASPLFRRVVTGADRVVAQSYRYLLSPLEAQRYLSDIQADYRLVDGDPGCCRLLHAQHIVRLDNMQSYVEARDAYMPTAELHAFEAEQIATKHEKAAQYRLHMARSMVLSPEAVTMVADATQDIEYLGQLMLYGLIRIEQIEDGWYASTATPELAMLNGPLEQLLDAFHTLIKGNPDLRSQLAQMILQGQSAYDYDRRSALDMQLEQLASSDDRAYSDIAIILAWAMENESL